jgi:macrodomain Ter protein organizer (MatP/YcbG family)
MALSTKRPSEKNRLLEEVRATTTPTRRLNIDVEATLYRRMKTQAVKEDRTLSDITRQLWQEYLSKNSDK